MSFLGFFILVPISVFALATVAGYGWRLGRGPVVSCTISEWEERAERNRELVLRQLVDPEEQL